MSGSALAWTLLSSDSHIVEPPDLWATRIDKQYRDRAPHVVAEKDADWWFVDGVRTNSFQGGAQAGVRFESQDALRPAAHFREVRPGAYRPDDYLRDNDHDGVHGSIIYPTEGLQLFRVHDDALLAAVFRAYNDWLGEFCRTNPARLKGIALINVEDVPGAVAELQRTRKAGLAGAMITVYPREDRSYDHPEYAPFWAAAQDLDAPISLHIDTNRPAAGTQREAMTVTRPAPMANSDHWVRMSLGHMIFTGVFERYPRLRVGSVEHELSWAPHFLDRLDYTYTQRARREGWYRYRGDAVPSDFFHRNVFLSFQEDALGIRDRALIGVDQLMWGSDYPHTESTFPRSRQILARILADVPEEEQRKITQGNAARLYGMAVG
jgi:predicted TIM-barrel fold metal-dependent hydrolase